jgi:hypothetical protein
MVLWLGLIATLSDKIFFVGTIRFTKNALLRQRTS